MSMLSEQRKQGPTIQLRCGDWLHEIVFGLNDGLVTTLVFLMVVSSIPSAHLFLILLGEVVAGGVSMALGGYLSARTSQQVLAHWIARERDEVVQKQGPDARTHPAHREISAPLLEHVSTHLVTAHQWRHAALVHAQWESVLGEQTPPWVQGMHVGLASMVGGLIPSLPVLLALPSARWWAYALASLTTVCLGAIKSRYTGQHPLWCALELLVIVTIGTLTGVGLSLLFSAG